MSGGLQALFRDKRFLALACFGSSVATYVMFNAAKSKIVSEYASRPYYRDAIRALRRSEGAERMLGKPIIDTGGHHTTAREGGDTVQQLIISKEILAP